MNRYYCYKTLLKMLQLPSKSKTRKLLKVIKMFVLDLFLVYKKQFSIFALKRIEFLQLKPQYVEKFLKQWVFNFLNR